jgi:hypothetical protein
LSSSSVSDFTYQSQSSLQYHFLPLFFPSSQTSLSQTIPSPQYGLRKTSTVADEARDGWTFDQSNVAIAT